MIGIWGLGRRGTENRVKGSVFDSFDITELRITRPSYYVLQELSGRILEYAGA